MNNEYSISDEDLAKLIHAPAPTTGFWASMNLLVLILCAITAAITPAVVIAVWRALL